MVHQEHVYHDFYPTNPAYGTIISNEELFPYTWDLFFQLYQHQLHSLTLLSQKNPTGKKFFKQSRVQVLHLLEPILLTFEDKSISPFLLACDLNYQWIWLSKS